MDVTPAPTRPVTAAVPVAQHSDRRLAIVAGLAVATSAVAVLVRALGLLSSTAAAGVAIVGVAVVLRVVLLYAARGASSADRARVLTLVSTAGLAVSAVTVVASLPHLADAGGIDTFLADLLAQLWTLGLVMAAAGPVRTLGWRVFAGACTVGFLAVPAVARLVGTPVVDTLGADSLLATAVYVPVTEELLKALPVVAAVVLAVRRPGIRPSALDGLLLGAWTGAGFALYENATYGRGGFDGSAGGPFPLLVPSAFEVDSGVASMVIGGHLVLTALVGFGVAVTVLYRRRFRHAWLAAPVALLVVIGEHIAVNTVPLTTPSGEAPLVQRILSVLTLGGRLSMVLLVAAVVAAVVVERRAIRPPAPAASWLQLGTAEAARRLRLLGAFQRAPAVGPADLHPEVRR